MRAQPYPPLIFSFVLSEIQAEPPFLFCGLTSGEVLSLVEVLIIQMLFSHLLHCHTAYIPKNLVVFRILPENSIFLNSHLLMF